MSATDRYVCKAGRAAMLGEPTILFPRQLAEQWRRRGLETYIVTRRPGQDAETSAGTPIRRSTDHQTRFETWFINAAGPLLYKAEGRYVRRHQAQYARRFGREALENLYYPRFVYHVLNARPLVRTVYSLRPAFVFGHEVNTYGVATALCRNIPRILFPWGADIYLYAETSPVMRALTRYALNAVDLVVPSSSAAARFISQQYGVDDSKVKAISWGVNLGRFVRAGERRRHAICERWGINPHATILLNARRFEPEWGCFVALLAFIEVAKKYRDTHFILIGGESGEPHLSKAHALLDEHGLLPRFALLRGEIALSDCADAMLISDAFVSLNGMADMRSSSVLQAAASGGLPVISDTSEYREMRSNGFGCLLVQHDDAAAVFQALSNYLEQPARFRPLVEQNEGYLARYEDQAAQMDKLLLAIQEVCQARALAL